MRIEEVRQMSREYRHRACEENRESRRHHERPGEAGTRVIQSDRLQAKRFHSIFSIEVKLSLGAAVACFVIALLVTLAKPESPTLTAVRGLWVAGIIYVMIAGANFLRSSRRIPQSAGGGRPTPSEEAFDLECDYINTEAGKHFKIRSNG